MSTPPFIRVCSLLLAGSAILATSVPSLSARVLEQETAFVHVNVVPMNRETILLDHTVLVRDGVIVSIGPSDQVVIPAGSAEINGTGRYLMPGLADLHVHLRLEEDLPVYLANGVTTLLDMGSAADLLQWRDRIENRELVGPHLLVSYFIDGPGGRWHIVETEDDAREAIRRAGISGYDFIKVYNSLTSAQFEAILDEAKALEMAVIGHGVRQPGMQEILESGQVMVAHAEEFIYTVFQNTTDRSLIPAAVDLVKRTGTFVLPNLSAYETITAQIGRPAVVDSFLAQPEVHSLHPSWRQRWLDENYARAGRNEQAILTKRLLFLRELTREFSAAGVPLLLGTDSPWIPGMFPGASINIDLRNMVQAGLTPYEALSAGTRTAGKFVQQTIPGSPVFGVVAEGARADLILLADNPLDDVAAVKQPLGVMLSGTWRTGESMRQTLDALYED